MPWSPTDLVTKWGAATDATDRAGRLAPVEVDVLAQLKMVQDMVGPTDPLGGYANLGARLAALSAATTGWRLPVRAKTVGNVNLATLDANAFVDGVDVSAGDRVLVADQTITSQNGVYQINAAGSPATRVTDWTAGADFPSRAVWVIEGTINANSAWRCANTSVTVGTTGVVFAKAQLHAPRVVIAASDASDRSKAGADYVCDGTRDEDTIIYPMFLAALVGLKGLHIELTEGTFRFGNVADGTQTVAVASLLDGLTISGQGPRATVITADKSITAFSFSGTNVTTRRWYQRLQDLSLTDGDTNHTLPAVTANYCSHFRSVNVEYGGWSGGGFRAVSLWDSEFDSCDWVDAGSKGLGPYVPATGLGGRPSVLILGDDTVSGLPAWGSNSIRFRACMIHSHTDGGIVLIGANAGEWGAPQQARVNNVVITDTKFETSFGGYAPALRAYRCFQLWVDDTWFATLNNFNGSSTAQTVVDCELGQDLWLSRVFFQKLTNDVNVAQFLRLTNQETAWLSDVSFEVSTTTGKPTVACVTYTGTNNGVTRRGLRKSYDVSGTTTLESGTSTALAQNLEWGGSVTITHPATSATVTHKLARAPLAHEITVVLTSNPATDIGYPFVQNITATTFDVATRNGIASGSMTFAWHAKVDNGG